MKRVLSMVVLTCSIMLLGALLLGCIHDPATAPFVESFDGWARPRWGLTWSYDGTVYLDSVDERGKVLCIGETGQNLPLGNDWVKVELLIPKSGATIEFDYRVDAAPNTQFTAGFREMPSPWLTIKEDVDWTHASITVSPELKLTALKFEAARISDGTEGICVCLDNLEMR